MIKYNFPTVSRFRKKLTTEEQIQNAINEGLEMVPDNQGQGHFLILEELTSEAFSIEEKDIKRFGETVLFYKDEMYRATHILSTDGENYLVMMPLADFTKIYEEHNGTKLVQLDHIKSEVKSEYDELLDRPVDVTFNKPQTAKSNYKGVSKRRKNLN